MDGEDAGHHDPPGREGSPDNVVVVLLDSLNRHMLGAYGGNEFDTPNLDRFAAAVGPVHQALHRLAAVHAGPPRHPLRRARLPLAAVGVDRDLGGRHHARAARGRRDHRCSISDHPHLFETGGENYHTDFSGVGLRARPRGRPLEDRARPDLGRRAARCRPARHMPYDNSRGYFRDEDDFPGPRTMAAAARWIDDNAGAPRPLPAVRRRVRSARAVRHARAVGVRRYDATGRART